MNGFNRPYVRNGGAYFTPLYLPGETYSYYINMPPIDDVDFADFKMYLIRANDLTETKLYDFGFHGSILGHLLSRNYSKEHL